GAGVREDDRADAVAPRVREDRDEAGIAPGVTAEDTFAATPQLDPEPPADRPVGLDHDLQVVHLVGGRGLQHGLVWSAEERAPAREVGGRAVEAGLAALPAELEHRLASDRVGGRLNQVPP